MSKLIRKLIEERRKENEEEKRTFIEYAKITKLL